MKRTILSFAILASISMTSLAATDAFQQKKGSRDFPKELKLSEEQKGQMQEINKDFDQKIEAVKKSRIVAEVQQERIKNLNSEKREAIAKILTPEQQAAFEKKMPRGERGKKGNHSHRGNLGNRIAHKDGLKMFENLNLTDAQKAQMKELKEKHAEERKAAHKKHNEEIMKILTPEQKKQVEENKSKFEESRKERKEDMQKMRKLDNVAKEKLKALNEKYKNEKGAIERSRIAPDMQKMKLQILKENFEKEKKELLDSVE